MSANVSSINKLPGHWFWGNTQEVRADFLGFMLRAPRECGDWAKIRLGPKTLILVSNPHAIEQILATHSRNFMRTPTVEPLLGNGLIRSEGEFWRRQRRIIQPSFDRQHLHQAYLPVIIELAQQHMDGWGDQRTFDIHQEMVRLTMAIIAKTMMNVDVSEDLDIVSNALEEASAFIMRRASSGISLPLWLPTPNNRRLNNAMAPMNRLIYRLIKKRREDLAGDDLLSRLVRVCNEQGGDGMSSLQIRNEVATMLLAGHETSASGLTYVFYLLAQHQEVQLQLQEEIQTQLGNRPITADDARHLPLMQQVIFEALRLYPPIHSLIRRCVKTCEIDGVRISRGASVVLNIWAVHHDHRWWSEPDQFAPERWEPPAQKNKSAYFAFGAGPHRCIGESFAKYRPNN